MLNCLSTAAILPKTYADFEDFLPHIETEKTLKRKFHSRKKDFELSKIIASSSDLHSPSESSSQFEWLG